jgi:hypothetical protein
MAALPQDQAALDALVQAAVAAAVAQAQAAADAAALNAANVHAAALAAANANAALIGPGAPGAAAGAAVGQPAGAVAIPFAINPAGGAGNAPWDLQSGYGLRLFLAVTAPIDPIFDGAVINLNDFLRKVWNRAESFGFTSILMIADSTGVIRNLTREFGCLSVENVKTAAVMYLRTETRNHQAAEMLRMLIQASIQPRLLDRLFHRRANYAVDIAVPGGVADLRDDGPCMLLELISMVSVETRAMIANIKRQLNDLQPLMEECKSDVEVFNSKVEFLIDALNARKSSVPELLTNLFTGYKSCADKTFVKYIARKEESFEDGTLTITDTELMQMALEKFKTLSSKGTWLKKTTDELDFIAMQSQIKELKQNPPKGKDAKGKGKDGKDKTNRNTGKYAWKGVAPKAGEPHEKAVEGKSYIYCPHHESTKWVLKVNNQGVEHKTGCLKMAAALAALGTPVAPTAASRMIAAIGNIEVEEEVEEEQI